MDEKTNLVEVKLSFPLYCIAKGLFHNKWLQGAFVLGAVLITTVLTVPGFHNLFKVETLNLMQLGCVYLYAFASLLIIQLLKCIRMKLRKRGER